MSTHPSNDRLGALAQRSLAVLLAAATGGLLLALAWRLPWIASDLGLAYNEGWNAYHAAAVRDGRSLYPDLGATATANNYPPLSFLLIGGLGRLGADPLHAGRWLNLLGLVVTVLLVARSTARLGGELPRRAWLAALLCTVPFVLVWREYLGIDDPKMLDHAVMLAGLQLAIGPAPTTRALAGAGVVMAIAGFIKHNLLPLPLAVVCWLSAARRWREAGTFAGAGVVAAILLTGSAMWSWGPAFLDSLLHTPRTTSLARASWMGHRLLAPLLPWLVPAALLVLGRRTHSLAGWYLAWSGAIGLAALTGEGVWASGVFDVAIAAAMVVGTGRGLDGMRGRPWLGVGTALAVVGAAVMTIGMRLPAARAAWHPEAHATALATTTARTAILRRASGPVLCVQIADCYLAGLPWRWDPFNTAQAIKQRHPAGDRFLAWMASGGAPTIATRGWPPDDDEKLPEAIVALLRSHYDSVAAVGSTVILRWRGSESSLRPASRLPPLASPYLRSPH